MADIREGANLYPTVRAPIWQNSRPDVLLAGQAGRASATIYGDFRCSFIRSKVVSGSNDPMAAVHQYVDAFNNGDEKAMAAACADPMQILDGMSPHVWQRSTAADDWYADALAQGEHPDVTDYQIGLDEPRQVDVTGDYAYVVVPATLDYNRQGKQVNQTGAAFTVALRKVHGDWRLAAWA